MKKHSYQHWFVLVALLGAALILLGEPNKLESLMSSGTKVIIVAVLLATFYRFSETQRKLLDFADICLILFSFFAFLSFIYSGKFFYDAFVPFLCFLELPLLINSAKHSEKSIRICIFVTFYVLSLYYLFLSFSPVAHTFVKNHVTQEIPELTLGFSNPNETAMYLLIDFFVLWVAFSAFKNKLLKIAFLVNALLIFGLMLQTESRTCIIVGSVFVVLMVTNKVDFFAKHLNRFVYFIPAFFFLFILFGQNIYADLFVLGESFDTGRSTIFLEALEQFNFGNVIFGYYEKYASQNLHNSFFTIMVTYGIVTLLLFICFFSFRTREASRATSERPMKKALIALYMAIISSSFEAAFLVSGSLYAVSIFVLWYLSLPLIDQPKPIERDEKR